MQKNYSLGLVCLLLACLLAPLKVEAQCTEITNVAMTAPANASQIKYLDHLGAYKTGIDAATTFTASASGATAYEWYVDGMLQIGQTGTNFNFTTPVIEGVYSVYSAAVNACTKSNKAKSKEFTIIVTKDKCVPLTDASIISSVGEIVTVGNSTILTANPLPSNATGAFTYVWERLSSSSWITIVGATSASYTVPNAGLNAIVPGANEYRVKMTGKCGGEIIRSIAILGHVDGQELDAVPPHNFMPYVGAFWKSNQTGERLIRIPRPTVYLSSDPTPGRIVGDPLPTTPIDKRAIADGAWRATVLVGVDWIVLDTQNPTGTGVWTNTPSMSGNDPAFETTPGVQLTGGLATVTGTMDASTPQIYFRIGLKSTISSTNVRYGVVLLTYNNNTKAQRIFIRQGDAPDYLMRPGDPLHTDSDVSAGVRTTSNTKKFSPYNLTASTLNVANTSGTRKFTDYPTQAGGLWLFMGTGTYAQYAWDAYSSGLTGNATYNSTTLWNTTNETCPAGYRRVTDGSTISVTTGMAGPVLPTDFRVTTALMPSTEMRHSLYEIVDRWYITGNPNVYVTRTNAIWGYYADGFFDRRQIVNAPNMTPGNGEALSAVSVTNANIAYAGLLFWNPNNNASLFFPGAGYRDPVSMAIHSMVAAGNNGCYMTSSTPYGSSGNYFSHAYMGFGSDGVHGRITLMVDGGRGLAIPIRCVQE